MKKLPVIGSTAASTAFCTERLEGPGGLHLFLDGNGKITAGNGTLASPRPNALSLPSAGESGIEHCPGSTATCRAACYVQSLRSAQPDLYALYEHNAETIRAILDCPDESVRHHWVTVLGGWIRNNAAGGFRHHVSGDIISLKHAQWIADVCAESPTVRHWIYTRSFEFLAPLVAQSTIRGRNLSVNLSCDSDNFLDALTAASTWNGPDGTVGSLRFPRLRLCYLTVDGKVPEELDEDDVIFPDLSLRPRQFASFSESPWWNGLTQFQRGLCCPVDSLGKSEKIRCGLVGHCDRCLR